MASTTRRHHVAAALVAVAALAIAGVGWAMASDKTPSVRAGSGGPSDYARFLRLDGGRAGYVAVSSSDPIKVWWRVRGETAWSDPEVVDGGSDHYLIWTNVRLAGTTLAIRAFYNTQPPWEDEVDEPGVATSVFIVCQPRSCVASDHYEHVQEPPCRRGSCLLSRPESKGVNQVPELSADGDQVYFGATEKGYV